MQQKKNKQLHLQVVALTVCVKAFAFVAYHHQLPVLVRYNFDCSGFETSLGIIASARIIPA